MLYNDAVHAFLRAKRGARRSQTTIDWYDPATAPLCRLVATNEPQS